MARDLTRRQALAGSAGLALAPALAAPGGALARRDATDHFAVDVPLPRGGRRPGRLADLGAGQEPGARST